MIVKESPVLKSEYISVYRKLAYVFGKRRQVMQ